MIRYKYRANAIEDKDSTRDIEQLLNDEIWASSFSNLNDPFEATYTDDISKVLPIFNQVFNVNISDIQKNWIELMAFKDKLGIYSLSTSDKDFPDNECGLTMIILIRVFVSLMMLKSYRILRNVNKSLCVSDKILTFVSLMTQKYADIVNS